jgi:hypothetical protein
MPLGKRTSSFLIIRLDPSPKVNAAIARGSVTDPLS